MLHTMDSGVLPALQSLIYIIVIAIFIITFAAQPFRIPSESMEPTLLVGDFLLVNKQSVGFDEAGGVLPATSIRRGDIVVFHYPVEPSLHLIKRVVGVPGDHLKLHDGRVYINGRKIVEPYAVYRASSPDNFRDNFPRLQSADPDIDSRWWVRMHNLIDHGELIIPTDNYFVLGDNRNDSEDSRYWGFVPRSAIVGKPFVIYFSLRQGNDDLGSPAELRTPEPARATHLRWIETLVDFARWDRILQIVH
jgi:signal peptidase I